jgi:hypothetical protein
MAGYRGARLSNEAMEQPAETVRAVDADLGVLAAHNVDAPVDAVATPLGLADREVGLVDFAGGTELGGFPRRNSVRAASQASTSFKRVISSVRRSLKKTSNWSRP